MAQSSLVDLTQEAAKADGPSFTPASVPKLGGVDPLGLRQINFDLMDEVLPGLNNVARHIRPFVVVAWAWRRAKQLAERQGFDEIPVDDLRDFVDRIEVIYAWSQFLRNPNADLPGGQVLEPLLKADHWAFGGPAWRNRRKVREYSTAFSAPINYGPGLKMLGWVEPHKKYSGVLIATSAADSALDAFESKIKNQLEHPAFNKFGSVKVTRKAVLDWGKAWALEKVTAAEKRCAAEMIFGSKAPLKRRLGGSLMLAAVEHTSTTDFDRVRTAMAGAPSNFAPAGLDTALTAWRYLQVRQLFRFSLEAFLYWIIIEIGSTSRSTDSLLDAFVSQAIRRPGRMTAWEWLHARNVAPGPIGLINKITRALENRSNVELVSSIVDGLALSLAEAPQQDQLLERADRLPLFLARQEAEAWGDHSIKDFVRHVLESWVLAQHVYWSVGRGLADARAGGKTILRLKVVLEEAGWTLAPGASQAPPPQPTPDRLQTALNLAEECGLLVKSSA
jgi:hypothetical protein